MTYRFLEHTADVKFVSEGKTIEEAFVSAFDAVRETVYGKIVVLEQEKKEVKISGKDFESLLLNFLEEFLFLLDSGGFLPAKIEKIEIDSEKFELFCIVTGDKADNYKFTNDVKAVTYNEMFVRKEKDRWVCQVVLDV